MPSWRSSSSASTPSGRGGMGKGLLEPQLPVLLEQRDRLLESLAPRLLPFRGLDPQDVEPAVGRRELLEALPGLRVRLEPLLNVLGHSRLRLVGWSDRLFPFHRPGWRALGEPRRSKPAGLQELG